MNEEILSLRATFDQDPELYDRARPRYPAELFDDLRVLAGIGPGGRVVEIGPGTGQATHQLLEAGARVVAVEPGAGLAAKLRSNLRTTDLEVVVSPFETWSPPPERFDAVVAFTSWHWIDPSVRAAKVAALLRPGGSLITTYTRHVVGGSEQFFDLAQACYERWDPGQQNRRLAAQDVPPYLDEVDDCNLFQPASRHRYEREVTFTAGEYISLLGTYSVNLAMSAEKRLGLFGCLAGLLAEFDDRVTKRYLYETRIAHRRG